MSRVVRVIPDVTTFAVDEGFSYLEPDDLSCEIGSLVRVPLGARTVRGWVVDVEGGPREGLKPIRRVSGTLPVFGSTQLDTYRWLAHHYVAPVATILRAATPPNLPTRVPRPEGGGLDGRTRREHFPGLEEAWDRVGDVEASVMVIAPTGLEVQAAAARLRALSDREVVVVDPGAPGADVTRAWSKARLDDGIALVGTGRLAMWWVRGLGAVVLLDEGRRSHKERQTPTLHPRTILSHRARLEGFLLATTGLIPTLETVATGAPFQHARRLWPRVEVIDRNEEPPGRGVLSERVKQAIRHAVNTRRTTLVFTHRRGYAPAFRCTSCGELRRCTSCHSAATNAGICPRCGSPYVPCAKCGGRSFEPLGAAVGRVQDLMRALVGPGLVGEVGTGAAVQVGTERDLAAASPVQLAVIVDGDRILLGTNFRATEDGLRLMARVAGLVEPGPGNRAVVQTSIPEHAAMSALRHGDPTEFLAEELRRREESRMPPSGDLMVLETRGAAGLEERDVAALEADGAVVFGPRPGPTGERWLMQAPDLGRAKSSLRSMVRRMRDQGSDVRIDADPIEL